ncbi:MAG: helix-turn-helix transcriptional regulator [Actinoplanes sp.]
MVNTDGSGVEQIEIVPLTVVAQAFPTRPSALPDVRAFVRRQLADTPVSEDDVRALGDRVADVLLEAAGGTGVIQVSLRIFPGGAEVDVLVSAESAGEVTRVATTARPVVTPDRPPIGRPVSPPAAPSSRAGPSPSFARWLAERLREEGLTMEAAARRLNVSAKTIGRWVGGTTEPRLRDLYRIREVLGEPPLG